MKGLPEKKGSNEDGLQEKVTRKKGISLHRSFGFLYCCILVLAVCVGFLAFAWLSKTSCSDNASSFLSEDYASLQQQQQQKQQVKETPVVYKPCAPLTQPCQPHTCCWKPHGSRNYSFCSPSPDRKLIDQPIKYVPACGIDNFCGRDSDCPFSGVCSVQLNDKRWGMCQPARLCEFGWTWNSHTNRCYKFFEQYVSVTEAKDRCAKVHANITAAKSKEENYFIQNQLLAYTWIWIDLSDSHKEGEWRWGDGAALTWTHWNKGDWIGLDFAASSEQFVNRISTEPDNGKNVGSGETEEDCVIMNHAGYWNDVPCERPVVADLLTHTYPYVCSKPINGM